jgi:hypothetical protein
MVMGLVMIVTDLTSDWDGFQGKYEIMQMLSNDIEGNLVVV